MRKIQKKNFSRKLEAIFRASPRRGRVGRWKMAPKRVSGVKFPISRVRPDFYSRGQSHGFSETLLTSRVNILVQPCHEWNRSLASCQALRALGPRPSSFGRISRGHASIPRIVDEREIPVVPVHERKQKRFGLSFFNTLIIEWFFCLFHAPWVLIKKKSMA